MTAESTDTENSGGTGASTDAPSAPSDETTGSPGARPAGKSPGGSGWELLEVLAAVILAAESLRIIGSLVAGILDGSAVPGVLGARALGNAIEVAANYSDGPGIVLLLVSLAMLWWRAEHWAGRLEVSAADGGLDGEMPVEGIQVRRLRGLTRWNLILFLFATAGAIAYLVGNVIVTHAQHLSNSAQWQAYADDLFSLAYAIIAVAGIAASVKLVRLCDAALDAARGRR
jgi:hypothetical protein